jgi:hypothetical protein
MEFIWPVFRRPHMAGFAVTTEGCRRRKALRRSDQAKSSYFSACPLLLRLCLGGALQALQGLLPTGGDGFRAKLFQQPAPTSLVGG